MTDVPDPQPPAPEAEPDPLAGLPPDLAAILRDQSIIVPQDARVFELIAKWAKAPSDTASADLPAPEASVDADRSTIWLAIEAGVYGPGNDKRPAAYEALERFVVRLAETEAAVGHALGRLADAIEATGCDEDELCGDEFGNEWVYVICARDDLRALAGKDAAA